MGTCDSGTSLFAMNAFQRGLPPSSRRKDCLLAGSLPSTHTVWERSFKKTTRLHDPFPPPVGTDCSYSWGNSCTQCQAQCWKEMEQPEKDGTTVSNTITFLPPTELRV